uniref:Major facilitator superfamily (MFS) profile domain-containing protein n=1 Tax=Knipowitschia caucasica TaxID=637954 RepID=A0AAV2M8R3_KNICA
MDTFLQQLLQGNAVLLMVVLGVGGGFHMGFHITGLSSPSPFIQSFINSSWASRHGEAPPPHTTTIIWSLIVSMFAVGGLLGVLSARFMSSKLGRKKTMMCNSCISIAAALVILTSKMFESYEMVIGARVLQGFYSGLGSCTHLLYLGEISPRKFRGVVTFTASTFTSLGKLSGQVFGLSEVLGRAELWNVLLCVPVGFSVLNLLLLPFFPEAPRYLFIEKGDDEACRSGEHRDSEHRDGEHRDSEHRDGEHRDGEHKDSEHRDSEHRDREHRDGEHRDSEHRDREHRDALQSLWGPGDYKEEMEEMLMEKAAMEAAPPKSPLQLLSSRTVGWALFTLFLICGCNQMSGMSMVSTFSYDIFYKSGMPKDSIRYVTLALGVVEITTSICCGFLMEHVGRRPLFWVGYGVMAVCWVLVTVTVYFQNSAQWVPYLTSVFVITVIVFFCGGPGGGVNTLSTEIFVQSERMAAVVLVGIYRWGIFALLGLIFPFLIASLSSYCFLLFACWCLVGGLYSFFILPETKGKSVLQISEEFRAISLCSSAPPTDGDTFETVF